MKNAIHYTITPVDPAAHLFGITLTVESPDPAGQRFLLPAWIPGSYMIREFARNIVRIQAMGDGKPLALTKLDKHSWQAEPCDGPLQLHYEVYAWDLSVRAAHLDQTHGFFNGTSVFLRVEGQERLPHVVDIRNAEGEYFRSWRVATALRELKAKRYGFGTYVADDYDELIDHPVEMGNFELATFRAHGVPHDIVITGQVPNLDMARLAADLKQVCEAQIALFEPRTKKAPIKRYVFMTLAVGDGYGGLEHRASTALICSRADLPVQGVKEMSEGYRTYLGLCSHEYFHTWNVKRIKPAAFAPYDLQNEVYTPLLWLFEGFTSYYDDLMLVRSGLIGEQDYLKLLSKAINGVLRGSGRTKQSVAESSFDAWTKYYRQDENAPNAIVSYYAKGSLVGLALDLTIRQETRGKRTLDDIMRALWQRYGREFHEGAGEGRGVTEAEVYALFDEIAGVKLKRFFDRYVRGTDDLPLQKLLAPLGIDYADDRKDGKPSLGIRTSREGSDCKVANVYEGGAAHRAGVSGGDLLVAVDGLRVTTSNLDTLLSRYRPGDAVMLHVFRRDELLAFEAQLGTGDVPKVSLTAEEKPVAAARQRALWLS
ncbi:Predicted metalloprotease, contains C-terminal PDZ domain [Noviherbaspirillum humi]|uniref:Predicted metalloprotease, contains C-terminal PDZ domain n=1 Tax=Noviherbaspirillum humi TaxID=1688639 RepID=A0A239LQQ4_9BURK|nr:M61 family metallopeptidase [Noviherbaspirillum humi]SNT32620.1 Predicted metalloprotease, contains C-terminal PDZ domain [Noviherbaspirillum humi]